MKLSRLYQLLRWRLLELRTYYIGIVHAFRKTPLTFVIFAQGRTGSTLLVDLLRNCDQIYVDGEIFGSSMPMNVWFKRFYIRSLAKWRGQGKKYYGYRIKIYEMYQIQGLEVEEAISFVRLLIADGTKVIYLYRNNKFRQVLSSLIAEARNEYHNKNGAVRPKVFINTAVIPTRVEHLNQFTEQEKRVLDGFDHVSVSYEEDLLNPTMQQRTADRIAAHLGIAQFKINTVYSRTTSDNFADFVVNHEEVAQLAHELGYE